MARRATPNSNQLAFDGLFEGRPPPAPRADRGAPPEPPELGPAPAGPLPLTEALRLDFNVAIRASAGTGKTHNLIALCVHLLAGARRRREQPLHPHQLCLLTFTDKAAGELRARLFKRVDQLAHGGVDAELAATLAALDRPAPGLEHWRRVREQLGGAMVGTFHSLCIQLLRAAPPGALVSPSFEVLDEREARALLNDTVERVVLRALEQKDEAVVQLCREHAFGGGNTFGLVGWLAGCFRQIREEGLVMATVPVGDLDRARLELSRGIEQARAMAVAEERDVPALVEVAKALDGLDEANFFDPDRYPRIADAIYNVKRISPALRTLLSPKPPTAQISLRDLWGACHAIPQEQTARALLVEVEARYREALRRANALDFTGLLVAARDLLRDVPQARAAAQAGIGALLVDEFQDTNHLQLELCTLLSEKREGAPRPLGPALDEGPSLAIRELPLEPGFVCVVGDPKQSIYEFRGADVSVFEEMSARLIAQGGARTFLADSWRTSPELVGFLNGAFPQLFHVSVAGGRLPYELEYQPAEEDLHARRPSRAGPSVLRLEWALEDADASQRRAGEARAIARWLARLIEHPPEVSRSRGGGGPLKGGDVALLFRRFTEVETYRHALVAMGVRHRVVRGRGFFGAQEVVDLACLLALVANPYDALALAAVLRSPLVGLSDQALLDFAAGGNGLRAKPALFETAMPASASEEERERLAEFRALYRRLRDERDRLGVRGLLQVALFESGYRTAVAGAPFGEQALANLEKLLELAGRREAKGVSAAAFARELLDLYESEPREAQGDALDESDEDAVTLCTVHQAKGLEWPVVVLPDLAAGGRPDSDRLIFDRAFGLALRPGDGDDGKLASARHKRVLQERKRRGDAEEQRLLYVAMTRPRDLLVLGLLEGAQKGSWGEKLRQMFEIYGQLRAQAEPVDARALGDAPLHAVPAADPQAGAKVEALARRVLERPPPHFSRAVLPVTQLQEFDVCPRRYRFAPRGGAGGARGEGGDRRRAGGRRAVRRPQAARGGDPQAARADAAEDGGAAGAARGAPAAGQIGVGAGERQGARGGGGLLEDALRPLGGAGERREGAPRAALHAAARRRRGLQSAPEGADRPALRDARGHRRGGGLQDVEEARGGAAAVPLSARLLRAGGAGAGGAGREGAHRHRLSARAAARARVRRHPARRGSALGPAGPDGAAAGRGAAEGEVGGPGPGFLQGNRLRVLPSLPRARGSSRRVGLERLSHAERRGGRSPVGR